jgi:hypothetical protein
MNRSWPPTPDAVIDVREVGSSTARELERKLRDLILRGSSVVVVELPDDADLAAPLAGALLRAQRSLSWRNGRLVVVAPASVRDELAFMGLGEALDLIAADPDV